MSNQQIDLPNRLLAPGPVPMTSEISLELSKPMIHHRSHQFKSILNETLSLLKQAFQTSSPVMIHTSVGSGAMESSIVNLFSPNDPVLFLISGKFGERWKKIAQSYGLNCFEYRVNPGEIIEPQKLTHFLSQSELKFKGIFTQACETSTGVLNPIKELSSVCKDWNSETLFLVDAMTALGATPIYMDQWNIDVLIAGSQKAFGLPTGLSFISLSELAWKFQKTSTLPKFYFDLKPELESNLKNETRFSSSVSLINALNISLKNSFSKSSFENQLIRVKKLSEVTKEFFKFLDWELFTAHPSPSLTTVRIPEKWIPLKPQKILLDKYNIYVAGGQDSLKDLILRIGHIGHIKNEDQIYLFQSIVEMNHDHFSKDHDLHDLCKFIDQLKFKLQS